MAIDRQQKARCVKIKSKPMEGGCPLKRLSLTVWLMTAVFLLSACARLEMNYTIEENGTVEVNYLLAAAEQAESYTDLQSMVDAALKQAEINGFTVSVYHQDGYIGIKAEKTTKVEDLSKADSSMLGIEVFRSIIANIAWDYEPNVFHDTYKIKMDIDLRNIVDQNSFNLLPSDIRKLAQEAYKNSKIIFNITMPGRPVHTNADVTEAVRGKNAVRYSWTLHPGEYRTLEIQSVSDKNSTKNRLLWGIGVGTTLVIAIIYLFVRKLKNKESYSCN